MTFEEYKIYLQKHYSKHRDIGYFFHQITNRYIKSGARLLNAGCGNQSYKPDYLKKASLVIGVDVEKEILKDNYQLKNLIVTDLAKLPFSDSSFDIIIGEWLFEHLREPKKVIKEFSRVLRDGGLLIFMTSNLNNPLILLSHLLPTFIHKFFRKIFFGIKKSDTFKTYYRLNTEKKIDKILSKYNFHKKSFYKTNGLVYWKFSKLVLQLSILLDQISNYKIFNRSKMHFTACYIMTKNQEVRNSSFIYQCPNCHKELKYKREGLFCPDCGLELKAKIDS